jgi:hypothetical protein
MAAQFSAFKFQRRQGFSRLSSARCSNLITLIALTKARCPLSVLIIPNAPIMTRHICAIAECKAICPSPPCFASHIFAETQCSLAYLADGWPWARNCLKERRSEGQCHNLIREPAQSHGRHRFSFAPSKFALSFRKV